MSAQLPLVVPLANIIATKKTTMNIRRVTATAIGPAIRAAMLSELVEVLLESGSRQDRSSEGVPKLSTFMQLATGRNAYRQSFINYCCN